VGKVDKVTNDKFEMLKRKAMSGDGKIVVSQDRKKLELGTGTDQHTQN